MFKKNQLFTNSSIYFAFTIVDYSIPFLLLPFITRKISVEDYGTFVIFNSLIAIIGPLLNLGIFDSLILKYLKSQEIVFKKYFTCGYILILSITLIVSFLFIYFKEIISQKLSLPSVFFPQLLSISFFQINTNYILYLFRIQNKVKHYGFFTISLTLLKNILSIYFIFIINNGVNGLINGYLYTYILFFFLSILYLIRNDNFGYDFDISFMVEIVKIGFPLFLHQTGSWLSSSATRIIMGGILGASAIGSFAIGSTISLITLFVQDAFNKAYVPYLFRQLDEKNYNVLTEKKIINITYIYNISLIIFATIIGTFGYFFVGKIFGIKYENAKNLIIFLSLANAFDGLYKMHVNYIFFKQKTGYIFFITLFTGILNIMLSFLLVRNWGVFGGAISLLIVNIVAYLLAWFFGNKFYPMNWFYFLEQKQTSNVI